MTCLFSDSVLVAVRVLSRMTDEGMGESRAVERRRHDEMIYHWLNDNGGERVE